jgi:hypothetical protein
MRKVLAGVLVCIGCGGGGSSEPPDVDASGEWTQLIGRSWTVPAGSADTYKCTRIAISQDVWVSGFRERRAAVGHVGDRDQADRASEGPARGRHDVRRLDEHLDPVG